jgi:Trk K+ transport system NAD-binding subunit
MKRIAAMAAAGALVLAAGTASAAQMSGQIVDIDRTGGTLTIGDTIFAVSPTNTVGPNLTELQEGDEVQIFYSEQTDTEMRYNAMTITKVGEGGATDEVSGRVEQVDTTANTFVVGDKTFVVPPQAATELNDGDEVMVVYDTADTEEPIQAINISKTN